MKTIIILLMTFLWMPNTGITETTGYDINDEAMDFNLKNVDGEIVSLKDFTNAKGVILSFTCNECPYAKLYEDRTVALDKEFAPKGFPVIAINANVAANKTGERFEDMVKRAKEKKFTFPYLADDTQEITRAYGASNTPHVYVLQREGDSFFVKYIGAIDNNPKSPEKATRQYVREAVNAIIDGKNVEESKTKAIGCGIKWKEA